MADITRMTESRGKRALRPVTAAPPFASLRTISALILREMSSSYGRSIGGYAWVILEPALGILLLVVLFSASGLRSPALGQNWAIFYASGMLPFFTYVTLNAKVSQAINYSKQLLSYPRVTFIDTIIARTILTTLTQITVSALIFGIIMTFMDTRTVLRMDELILAYAMAVSVGASVGIMNCVLMMRFPIWQTMWGVMNRPMIILSGVIVLHDDIPQPFREWLEWNPLVHVVGQARKAFYYSYEATYVDPLFVFGITLPLATLGLIFLRKYYRDFMER